MNVVLNYVKDQFTQPNNGLKRLILFHILSFLLLFVFNTSCYICGYENFIHMVYQKLTLPSLYPLLLRSPWTILTHSFVHKRLLDLFWNVVMLYYLGNCIRAVTRFRHLWWLYGLGQFAGALVFCLLHQFSPPFKGITAYFGGPSAAIYALMVATCIFIPCIRVNLYLTKVPLKYFVLCLLALAFLQLQSNQAGYCLAQLSGAVVGYLYASKYRNEVNDNWRFFRSQGTMHASSLRRMVKVRG